MAVNDEMNFKFPDEEPEKVVAGDDFEIEIEDDTPEEDRGRTPSDPEKVRQLEIEVDDIDDLAKYKAAKDKIIRMKRVWNDERRARELAEREHQVAIDAARKLYAENQRIKELVNSKADEYQESLKEATNAKLKTVKREFKDAYEAGDSDAMAEAQEKMTRLQVELESINTSKNKKSLQDEFSGVQTAQEERYIPPQAPQVPRPDSRVLEWQDENQWFGQNRVMTATALGVHEELKDNGIEIGSEKYYAELDKTMRKRFPDYFGDDRAEPEADKPKAKPATVVASATRTTAPKRVRLNQSQVSIAKKLGLTPEQYVRELMKLEA